MQTMNLLRRATVAGSLAIMLAGVVPLAASADVTIRLAPPAARYEVVPPPPDRHHRYVWTAGNWRWDGHRYGWTAGRYVQREHGNWQEGKWEHRSNGWMWNEGRWN